ncbi:hypothetical protein NDK25_08265 [Niallia taxi]|nr:hypothetical protein [Niallia taxi]
MVANSNLPGVTSEYNELAEETQAAIAKLKVVLQEATARHAESSAIG